VLSTAEAPPPVDSTAALQAKFDQLKPGETLKLDRSTYLHSGVIQLRVPDVQIDGNGATLQATNDETSAVQIDAGGVSLTNLNLTAALKGGHRWSGLDQHKLVVKANGVTVSDLTINGSAGGGVFVYGASNFKLNRVTVRDTRGDGIHITNGSNNGQVNNPTTEWTGDDGVAVVSYGNEQPCHDIVINSPTVNGTTWGRGLTVVGGENISYRNITVSQTDAAGVYIASEGNPWYTRSVNKVDVFGGTVTEANTNPQEIYRAVLVYSGNAGQSVSDVTISGLTISGTPSSAQANVGIVVDDGTISKIAYTNIALQNTELPPLDISPKVPAGSYTTSGWTLDGTPITVP
jgi:hypothetical protein